MNKKISFAEGFFLVGLCLLADLADLLLTFVFNLLFGSGEIVKLFINLIISLLLWFWAIIRGVKIVWIGGGAVAEFIPFINIMPARTVAIITTIYAHNKKL